MSDRMTSIHLPGTSQGSGWSEHGRKTVPEMIEALRMRAQYLREQSDMILSALDGDFRVETYIGPYVRRKREVLQKGREKS